MKTAFRALAIAALLLAAGCGPQKPWHATNITEAMPDLKFSAVRASDGLAVKADAYRGRIAVLYFGYTHCPDICPTTLTNLSDVLKRLGPDADKVQVLFVTVDPDRDTLFLLKQYAQAFAPQIDALRATKAQLDDVTTRYRVAYSVKTHPDYLVTHAGTVLVFDARGRARLLITDTADTAGLAEDFKRIIAE